MPRVAALLDVQQISDITAIDSEDSRFLKYVLSPPDILTVDSLRSADLRRKRDPHSTIIRQHQNTDREKYSFCRS